MYASPNRSAIMHHCAPTNLDKVAQYAGSDARFDMDVLNYVLHRGDKAYLLDKRYAMLDSALDANDGLVHTSYYVCICSAGISIKDTHNYLDIQENYLSYKYFKKYENEFNAIANSK